MSAVAAPARTSDAAAPPPAAPELPERVTLTNLTNKRLVLRSSDGMSLNFAPLEARVLRRETAALYDLDPLRARNFVALADAREEEARGVALLGVAFWGVLAWVIAGFATGQDGLYWLVGSAALALGGAVAWRAISSGAVGRWLIQIGSLAFVLIVGVALPGLAIWYGAGMESVVSLALDARGNPEERAQLTILGRSLQLLFIAAVSLLPGLLYFLFDRARLATLRDRFARHMFRFDRTVQTCADVQAKYGTLVDEAYGPAARAGVRLQPGTQWPLVVATVVTAFGWVITLLNPQVGLLTKTDGLTPLFEPWRSPVAFAFLGAYFFALHAILRWYVRGDLRPKTYSYITVRIIVVIVLAWVLETGLGSGDVLLLLAFLTGIVPDTALYRLREVVRGGLGSGPRDLSSLFDVLPLTSLDGIDLYDRARLEAEGVTNVEALAHHDLVDIMLQTRIPVPRLVDWTDQAILFLHLGGEEAAVKRLRLHGIRTATDLEHAYAAAVARGPDAERELLNMLPTEGDGDPPRLRVILDTMTDEEWMDALRYWHDPVHFREHTLRYPEDFQP